MKKYSVLLLSLCAVFALTLASRPSHAQSTPEASISKDGIVNALSDLMKTRAIGQKPAASKRQAKSKLEYLLIRRGLGRLTPNDRKIIVSAVSDLGLPAIDLEVPFEYNSARISAAALPVLIKLGQALSDERLRRATFLVAGHTDAKGAASYNLKLSHRRANSVKRMLVETFDIKAQRLIAVGFGEENLKLPNVPDDGQNRRVQLVNVKQLN